MKLLNNNAYKKIEKYMKEYYLAENKTNDYTNAIEELIQFFNENPYKDFLDIFYLNRYKYKNRYSSNSDLFIYLSNKLYVREPTLYLIRKEIMYKAAMIFYKYNLLGDENNVD